MFGVNIIGRGGYVWYDHYFLLIFVCSANNSITCIFLQDFWLAEKEWYGRWGKGE